MKLSILLALAALVQFADGFASTVRSNLQMSGVGLPKPPVVGPKNAAEVKAKFGDKSEFCILLLRMERTHVFASFKKEVCRLSLFASNLGGYLWLTRHVLRFCIRTPNQSSWL
mmetsp:Transcript_38975/g.79757  ORF Transcript_38975/g.79757 Transcript_38975/m.79757 type:complete len:113 (+) Transcript_38975:294-632(+)